MIDHVMDLRIQGVARRFTTELEDLLESNLGTQVNKYVRYTEIQWVDGVPGTVYKYVDNTKADLVYTITLSWVDGVPVSISRENHDNGITENIDITWVDGVPTIVDRTVV